MAVTIRRRPAAAIVAMAFLLVALGGLLPATDAEAQGEISTFTIPGRQSNGESPTTAGIAAGPDGNLWFTAYTDGPKVFRMTTSGAMTRFDLPAGDDAAYGITAGPDGNLWYVRSFGIQAGKVGRITTSGQVTEFAIPTALSGAEAITAGPDGNVWFTEELGGKVGRVTPDGQITEFPLPEPGPGRAPYGITTGPDGNLWFAEIHGNAIGRITPAGAITEFPIPTPRATAGHIASGPDGALWFTEPGVGGIGRITTSGVVAELTVPPAESGLGQLLGGRSGPYGIAKGPDGNLWVTEESGYEISRLSPGGTFTRYPIPDADAGSRPLEITAGPDGNMWFTMASGQIGRVRIGGPPPTTAPDPDPDPTVAPTVPPSGPGPGPGLPGPSVPLPIGPPDGIPPTVIPTLPPFPDVDDLEDLLAQVASRSGLSARSGAPGDEAGSDGDEAGADVVRVRAGGVLTVAGEGFGAGQELGIAIFSEPRTIGSAMSDTRGAFETTVLIPADVAPGRHTVAAAGKGPDGQLHATVIEVVVLRATPAESLSWWPAGLAIACLVVAAAGTGVAGWRLRR